MRELKFGECRWPTQVTPLENGKPGAHIPCSDFKAFTFYYYAVKADKWVCCPKSGLL